MTTQPPPAEPASSPQGILESRLYSEIWYIRVLERFGLPVMLILMFMLGFAFIGQWMINNQTRLIDSAIKTNESQSATNAKMADTLDQIRSSAASSAAMVLQSVQENARLQTESQAQILRSVSENGRVIALIAEAIKVQTDLLQSRAIAIERIDSTHEDQSEKLDDICTKLDDAKQMMVPAIKQRDEQLQKQQETNAKLDVLIEEVKKQQP